VHILTHGCSLKRPVCKPISVTVVASNDFADGQPDLFTHGSTHGNTD